MRHPVAGLCSPRSRTSAPCWQATFRKTSALVVECKRETWAALPATMHHGSWFMDQTGEFLDWSSAGQQDFVQLLGQGRYEDWLSQPQNQLYGPVDRSAKGMTGAAGQEQLQIFSLRRLSTPRHSSTVTQPSPFDPEEAAAARGLLELLNC